MFCGRSQRFVGRFFFSVSEVNVLWEKCMYFLMFIFSSNQFFSFLLFPAFLFLLISFFIHSLFLFFIFIFFFSFLSPFFSFFSSPLSFFFIHLLFLSISHFIHFLSIISHPSHYHHLHHHYHVGSCATPPRTWTCASGRQKVSPTSPWMATSRRTWLTMNSLYAPSSTWLESVWR